MTTSNRDLRRTIVHLLSNMSTNRESRIYLQRFSEVDQSRFAVIKVGGTILRDHLEETAASLAFLHTVGLTPIVLHGGGPQLDAALAEAGVANEKIDGLRVTDTTVLEAARQVFTALNIKLVEALHEQGVAAHGLITAAFDAEVIDERLGFVGRPTGVHLDLLRSIVGSGAIPVLTCLGIAPGGQLVNINADSATRLLVHAVQPLKIIFLSGSGGLLDEQGLPIESINLATDYDDLMNQPWVHSGMSLKLAEIKALLDDSDSSASVSITTPSGLARELFTHGGSGTLVRKGELINRIKDKQDADGDRLVRLINQAFGRELDESWWPSFELTDGYVSESYRAAALLSRVNGIDYLDKFAIHEEARGEGLARTVWSRLVRDHQTLFWRSRTGNSFNAFYAEQADGSVKRGPWTVFWRGETDFDRIAPSLESIAAIPSSFWDDRDTSD